MGHALGQYGDVVAEKPQRALTGELSIFWSLSVRMPRSPKAVTLFTVIFMMACHLDSLCEIYVYLISFLLCS